MEQSEQDDFYILDEPLTTIAVFAVSGEDLQTILDSSGKREFVDRYRVISGELIVGERRGVEEEYVWIVILDKHLPVVKKIQDRDILIATREIVIQHSQEALKRLR